MYTGVKKINHMFENNILRNYIKKKWVSLGVIFGLPRIFFLLNLFLRLEMIVLWLLLKGVKYIVAKK